VNPAVLSVFGLNPTRIGGTESYAHELSVQLGRHGWTSVLCFEEFPPEPVRQYLALPNVTIETVPKVWQLAWRPARDVARLLRRHRPSILHLQYTGFLSVYPWLARMHGVKRVFFTDQASRPEGHIIARARAWKRMVTWAVDHPLTWVISISEFNRRCLVEAGLCPEDRALRIYNAVDLARRVESPERGADFRRRHGIPDGRVVILQVSWIIPEKGIGDLLDAARTVLGTHPKAHFVFAGEGRSRQEYTRRAEDMGISKHVTWTGLVTDPFGDGLYAAADVVCQMSRWEEGFGWVIAEAMAHGRPVVGTRVGAIPEIVRDGVTGFLVNRGDSAAMADALVKLIRDPQLRARLGGAGRTMAEAEFDLRKSVAQVLGLYGIRAQ
jgi:glycosyltransferase involved in cell wall biosynthesis